MISIKQISYINNIGQRPQLEDSIYPQPGNASALDDLFMVCDGVGGESTGEEASRIACEEFPAYFRRVPITGGQLKKEYIQEAQKQVLGKMREFAQQHPEAQKMSTTLTLAHISQNEISVAWCGDSRIYHIRDRQVIWRSTDHSLVANLVKHGEITEEEARTHPQRNVITRSLSASGHVSEIDIHHIKHIYNGDYLMLCTDGVLEQIDEDRLKDILKTDVKDKAAAFLYYCEGKTKDNFSLYLLQLEADRQLPPPPDKKRNTFIIPILIALMVLALAAGLFLFKGTIQKVLSGKKMPDSLGTPVKPDSLPHDKTNATKGSPSAHQPIDTSDNDQTDTVTTLKPEKADQQMDSVKRGLKKIGDKFKSHPILTTPGKHKEPGTNAESKNDKPKPDPSSVPPVTQQNN